MEAATAWLPLLFGAVGVGVAFALYRVVVAYPAGDAKVTDIAEQIYIGAMTFMRREFTILAVVGVILFFLLGFGLGWSSALAFVVGAVASGLAGFFGMRSATKANVRTATAAHTAGAAQALTVSFFGGSVMGLLVASLGLLGLGFLFLIFGANPETAVIIQSFGVGASSVALFFRVGGGIFTKSADVGADLV
ncbi:MAG: sodium/proton-translocating pyrophosphatase, partial [Trueperaceae bacterium]